MLWRSLPVAKTAFCSEIFRKDIDLCFIFCKEMLAYLWLGIFLKLSLKLLPKF